MRVQTSASMATMRPLRDIASRPLRHHVCCSRVFSSQLTSISLSAAYSTSTPQASSASAVTASPSSSPSSPRSPIAILGGGLAGLTTALYLARALPAHQRIVLYESQHQLGGWVQSQRVAISAKDPEAGSVLLEGGPRSIRPKGWPGWSMIDLIHSLNLLDRLIIVPASAPSARNRFIWHSAQLNKLPSSLAAVVPALFRLPVLRSLFPSILAGLIKEPFRPSKFQRPKSESRGEVERQRSREHLLDESIEAFIRRRLGTEAGGRLVDHLLSGVLHGIYAANASKLSVMSTMAPLWRLEQRHGSLLRAMLPAKLNKRYREPSDFEKAKELTQAAEVERIKKLVGSRWRGPLEKASVVSFKSGIGELTRAMEQELRQAENVEIKMAEGALSLSICPQSKDAALSTSAGTETFSRIISAIPSTKLAEILSEELSSPTLCSLLTHNPSTSVGVVNVAIPCDLVRDFQAKGVSCGAFLSQRAQAASTQTELAEGGFGFLFPRSQVSQATRAALPVSDDSEKLTAVTSDGKTTHGILGVVFDSDAVPGQDAGSETYVKLTVMLGGPHPLPLPKSASRDEPTTDDLLSLALPSLSHHLSVPLQLLQHDKVIKRASWQQDCIPTYKPGHVSRMRRLHEELQRLPIQTNTKARLMTLPLTLAGASYTGVSLNDIVANAAMVARAVVEAESKGQNGVGRATVTGLESFVDM